MCAESISDGRNLLKRGGDEDGEGDEIEIGRNQENKKKKNGLVLAGRQVEVGCERELLQWCVSVKCKGSALHAAPCGTAWNRP